MPDENDPSKVITSLEKQIERKVLSIEERIANQDLNIRSQQTQVTDQIYRLCQLIEALDRIKNPQNHQQRAQTSIERLNRHMAILKTEVKQAEYLSGYVDRVEAINSKLQIDRTDNDPAGELSEDKTKKYRIWAKVSEGERDKIIELQRASGQKSLSTFIRQKALGIRIHTIPPINQAGSLNIAKLIRLTRNISSNLNQGIKAIHRAKLAGEEVPWEAVSQAEVKVIEDLLTSNLKVLTIIQKHLIRKHDKT